MIRIKELPAVVRSPSNGPAVVLHMTAEDRARVRRRLTAPDGAELGLSLPTGTHLAPGTLLHVEGATQYVVEAAPEDCLVIQPAGLREAARAGHLIGNLHRSIDFDGDNLVVLWDPTLEKRLQDLGFDIAREKRPFLGRHNHSHAH